jgi:hypothetical protein
MIIQDRMTLESQIAGHGPQHIGPLLTVVLAQYGIHPGDERKPGRKSVRPVLRKAPALPVAAAEPLAFGSLLLSQP